jgi:hypothetical protein
MNKCFHYNNDPYIIKYVVDKTDLSNKDNQKLINQAIQSYDDYFWKNGCKEWENKVYSCYMKQTPETDKLSKLFYKIMKSHFLNIETIDSDVLKSKEPMDSVHFINEPATYVSTKDKYASEWHSHVSRYTINMVYYAAIPDKTATLSLIDRSNVEEEIELSERLMIMFPGWVIHKPNPPLKSNKPRVCINMGYFSLNSPVLHISKLNTNPTAEFTDTYSTKYINW